MRPLAIAAQSFVAAGLICARAGAQTPAPDAIARLVGVDLGSDPSALLAAARAARVGCAEAPQTPAAASADRIAYVCSSPPIAVSFPASATYWYESGTLARVYFVGGGFSQRFADYLAAYEGTIRSWSWALGTPSWRADPPGNWSGARPLPDALRLQAIAAGNVTLRASWRLGTTTMEVRLYGEGGIPRLTAMIQRGDGAGGCSPQAIRDALFDLFPPASEAARTGGARRLAACHIARAAGALESASTRDPSVGVRAEARTALAAVRQPPAGQPAAPITAIASPIASPESPTPTAPRPAPAPAPVAAPAPIPVPLPAATHAAVASSSGPAAAEARPPQAATVVEPTNQPTPRPWTGTPLAIGASTVAGAVLMRDLGLMGGQGLSDVTPQLLLGTAGAVIGFGTSWGLSRFGFRPTVEQASWFANLTAWGTLEGVTLWSASNSTNPKLEYGAFALGETAGMGLGVLSARAWQWTAPQIALADGMLVGAVLPAVGIPLIGNQTPQVGTLDAIALPAIMVGAAIAAHQMDPTANDLRLMTFGALAGGWSGGLLASGATETSFFGARPSAGGVLVGAGLGFLGATAAGVFSETDGSRLGIATLGMLAGEAAGYGLHESIAGFAHADAPGATFTAAESHRWPLGAGAGGILLGAAAYAYAPRLQLGSSATAMTIQGALTGAGIWGLALEAGAFGPATDVDQARLNGGVLAGAVLGGVGGLVSSRWFTPDGLDQAATAIATGLGMAGGLGVARLATPDRGLADAVGVLLGAGVGFTGGALTAHETRLRPPDFGAVAIGAGFGALVGTLAPTLGEATWDGGRATEGGAWLGLALGGAGMAAAAHIEEATGAQIAVPSVGATLGLGVGFGAGLLAPCQSDCTSQAPRVGVVAGVAGGLGLGLLGEWRLHLSNGLGDAAPTFGLLGATFGIADGLMLAAAVAPSDTTAREREGGMLMAGSAELGVGILAARLGPLPSGGAAVLTGGKIAGAFMGLGTSMLVRTAGGRADPLAMLGGSLAGLGGAIVTEATAPLSETDAAATALGATAGGLIGTLAPSLDDDSWGATSARRRAGGLLLGTGAGAVVGAALRHGADATPRAVGLTAIGGADGLVTGLGFGLWFESGDASRAERIGAVAGTAAGLAMGSLVWPRLAFDDFAPTLTLAAGAVGGWTGAWLPLLGHADVGDVGGRQIAGGLLAGAGLSTAGALLLDPVLRPDPDLVDNAVALDAIWTGAGAGIGALASTRDDAPVWGMLTAGTAGLLLGGALHDSIHFTDADAPLLTLATAEGLWLGGWLPSAIWNPSEVTPRQRMGGLAAGGFGGLGLAALAGSRLELTSATAIAGGFGSLFGAAIGGGIALISPELHDRRGVGLLLGGSALGLAGGLAFAPELAQTPPATAATAAVLGGTLGAAESLLFAWSGHAADDASYGGAALIGGGIGATLGLVATATPVGSSGNVPAAAGFGAWGAWTGSFAGALIQNDPHEVVMGGLIGANAGFLAGYTLLRTGAVDPRDFGWLSLFGALGTVAGAGAGAPFSSRTDPAPVLAGLALGPAVGMACGGLLLPKLRRLANRPSSVGFRNLPARTLGGFNLTAPAGAAQAGLGRELLSSDIIGDPGPPLLRRLQAIVDVTEWSPLIGALPTPDQVGSPPLIFGVTGRWK